MDEQINQFQVEQEEKEAKVPTDGITDIELKTALPQWTAARTIELISSAGSQEERSHKDHLQLAAKLLKRMAQKSEEMIEGDMNEAERMLFAQAKTLEATASQFLVIASQLTHQPEHCERFTHMALRAQDQCRKTLLALQELKNPKKPAQFIKSYVDKQVNQLKVEQDSKPECRDMETSDSAPLDFGCSTATGREDQDMETVAAIHRTQNF